MDKPVNADRISRVVVLGVGGVGGYFGGLLARHFSTDVERRNLDKAAKITFVARGAHLETIREKGLLLNTVERSGLVCLPSEARADIDRFEPPDLCLVCVKGYDLDEVSRRLSPVAAEHTVIVPLLNGVDIRERIRKHVKTGIVLPACVYVSASIDRPGVVTQKGMAGVLISGKDPDHPGYEPAFISKFFEQAGISVQYKEDAYPAIWEKYLFIASFGLVTAWADQPFGAVLEDGKLRGQVSKIMEEIKAVAAKRGISFDDRTIESSLKKAENFPYETKTSYQRDVEKGGRNEGDLFGGTIVRLGRKLGVETPVTEKLYSEIEARLEAR